MSEQEKIRIDELNPELVESAPHSLNQITAQLDEHGHNPRPKDTSEDSAPKFIGGKYRVVQLLGRGGMGAVYKVHHQALDKTFAAKVLHKDVMTDFKLLQRFDQEAKSVGALNHQNLIAVHDYGTSDDGTPYLIMDFLEGHSLDEELKSKGPLGEQRALHIFGLVCDALKHAHEKGIIHRDIKPSNIMLVKTEDGKESVKIVDFGIAKREFIDSKVTQTGEVFGTPLYMSPEQCLGKACDARSDIYSLGCVMYEALTGIAPFAAENAVQTIFNHINEKPEPLRKANPEAKLSVAVEQLVAACLEKDPTDRISSVDQVVINLRRIESGQNLMLGGNFLKGKKEVAFKMGKSAVHLLTAIGITTAIFVFYYFYANSAPFLKYANEGNAALDRAEFAKAAAAYEEGSKLARAANAPIYEQVKFQQGLMSCYSGLGDNEKAYGAAKEITELLISADEFKQADQCAVSAWHYSSAAHLPLAERMAAIDTAISVGEKGFGKEYPQLYLRLLHRARLQYDAGNKKQAIADTERAQNLEIQNPEAISKKDRYTATRNLSGYFNLDGQHKQALKLVDDALEKHQDIPADIVEYLKKQRAKALSKIKSGGNK